MKPGFTITSSWTDEFGEPPMKTAYINDVGGLGFAEILKPGTLKNCRGTFETTDLKIISIFNLRGSAKFRGYVLENNQEVHLEFPIIMNSIKPSGDVYEVTFVAVGNPYDS